MPAPVGSGWWNAERRRLVGALAASCGAHLLVIGIWFLVLARLMAGVPPPAALPGSLAGPATRSAEMLVTSIEFRPKPPPPVPVRVVRHLTLPHTIHHQPKVAAVAVAPRRTPAPQPAHQHRKHVWFGRSAGTTAVAVAVKLAASRAPVPKPTASAALVTAAPSAQPTSASNVAEIGLWGLDSSPVLLDGVSALLGDVRRHLHIEIQVDEHGHATRVSVDDAGVDAALIRRVTEALLAAHYAAARCNNLPCNGQLVLVYP